MARNSRIEYPGAGYQVLCRGDQREPIFQHDADREWFLKTKGEVCPKTGWRGPAYGLMPSHYHGLIETPEGNLVRGLRWFQSPYGWYLGEEGFKEQWLGRLAAGVAGRQRESYPGVAAPAQDERREEQWLKRGLRALVLSSASSEGAAAKRCPETGIGVAVAHGGGRVGGLGQRPFSDGPSPPRESRGAESGRCSNRWDHQSAQPFATMQGLTPFPSGQRLSIRTGDNGLREEHASR